MEQGESSETLAQVILGNAYFSKEFIVGARENYPAFKMNPRKLSRKKKIGENYPAKAKLGENYPAKVKDDENYPVF